jgi:FAD-dependent urate hydroxylase
VAIESPSLPTRARVGSAAPSCATVVVGAGPYGLAAGAHLSAVGISACVFGEPMETWERHMPAGMLLRSRREASCLADPAHALGLDRFEAEAGLERSEPFPLERFVEYGHWFQRHAVPEVDRRRVLRVSAAGGNGFDVELDDGERLRAERVVVAAGIVPFARRLPQFDGISPDLVSHAVDHPDLSALGGKRVIVVGAGQSALESAALLAEAGAEVEVLGRRPDVRWLAEGGDAGADGLRFYAYRRIALGGPRSSWVIGWPDLWRRLPFDRRQRLAERTIAPAGTAWLRPRLSGVRITTPESVIAAEPRNGSLRLRLAGGACREAEHVLLATGYEVDVARYGFLSPELARHVRCRGGYPLLGAGFESSVPGLYFLGAPAALTFGPVMRFVCGTWAAARGLTRGIVGRSAPRAGLSW